jgi:hypothetical protein
VCINIRNLTLHIHTLIILFWAKLVCAHIVRFLKRAREISARLWKTIICSVRVLSLHLDRFQGDKGPGGIIYIILLRAKFASYSTVVKVLGFGHREKTASGYAAMLDGWMEISFVLALQHCLLEEFNVSESAAFVLSAPLFF